MFTHFLCGSSGGARVEEEEQIERVLCMGPSRRKASSSNNNKNNPYSTRGLDKFALVLADLEEKKLKICRQTGASQEILMVRFRCSSSKGWLPIVVKLRGIGKPNHHHHHQQQQQHKSSSSSSSSNASKPKAGRPDLLLGLQISERMKVMRLLLLVVLVAMVVLCLVRFGSSFGVKCACVSSYLVPLMKDNGGRLRKAKCRSSINPLQK